MQFSPDEEGAQAPLSQMGVPLGGFGSFPREGSKFMLRGQRQRLDIVSVFQCLILPWVVFCLVYAAMSFWLHFKHPTLCYFVVGVGLVVILAGGSTALRRVMRKAFQNEAPEPSWWVFLFLTTLTAWILGMLLGNINFWTNMQPYYDYFSLSEYNGVNPAEHRGEALMDAGRVNFASSTKLDLTRSMGFKDDSTYCVAPISTTFQDGTASGMANLTQPLASYDFWAVGVDCCSPNTASFHCGAFQDPAAHSGLRLLKDDQRDFFRLSVQMAEASYGIKAIHPLFFYWTTNATVEMETFREEGRKYYLVGMLVHFGWQLLAVSLAVCGFSRLGHY